MGLTNVANATCDCGFALPALSATARFRPRTVTSRRVVERGARRVAAFTTADRRLTVNFSQSSLLAPTAGRNSSRWGWSVFNSTADYTHYAQLTLQSHLAFVAGPALCVSSPRVTDDDNSGRVSNARLVETTTEKGSLHRWSSAELCCTDVIASFICCFINDFNQRFLRSHRYQVSKVYLKKKRHLRHKTILHRSAHEPYELYLDICEDSHFPVSASCVTLSNP
jgi:hypothetical protein